MTMTTVEVLRAARARIEDPKKWSSTGRGHLGKECALDAIECVVDGPVSAYDPVYQVLFRLVGSCLSVGHYNDTHRHDEVLGLFDQAIANEEAREAEFIGGDNIFEPVAAGGEMVLA